MKHETSASISVSAPGTPDNTVPGQLFGFSPYRFLAVLGVAFLAVNVIVRCVLQAASPDALPISGAMAGNLLLGLVNDAATLTFVLLLPATLMLLPAESFFRKRSGKVYAFLILFFFCVVFTFSAFAEYFFWDEFHARFNFIAVDYLIYTTEVMQNMVESYPLGWLLSAVFLLALAGAVILWKAAHTGQRAGRPRAGEVLPSEKSPLGKAQMTAGSSWSGWRRRLMALAGMYAVAALVFMLFTPQTGSANRFWNEYAKNGVYELFSAYRHNQLDYRAFYPTMNKGAAFTLMRQEMETPEGTFITNTGDTLVRRMVSATPERKANVVVVLMESMGSTWLGEYSPNLNSLAAEGLSFTRMMSTGTRTVRGIEAVMLSIPPTPGNSIVRRPDNDGLFTLGSPFMERGYDLTFLYGGVGFFDNMNAFFAGNGYSIVDKLGFASKNKTFSTAWGQCDEDLYAESLDRADASFAAGKQFQQVLLTTSNHRPYAYPEGRVAIRSGSSRKGAVSYSDYAIGAFMEKARTKPWFDNTVFVFVGDHPASIAGKTEVPPDGYGIVCVMYGPKFFAPERVDTLCSQIDVAPTLLASLGWDYRSQFFGEDARKTDPAQARAWVSTYQLLGFRNNTQLVVLHPDGKSVVTDIVPSGEGQNAAAARASGAPAAGQAVPGDTGGRGIHDAGLVDAAIASYQCAYDLFVEKKLKESVVLGENPLPQQAGEPAVHTVAGGALPQRAKATTLGGNSVRMQKAEDGSRSAVQSKLSIMLLLLAGEGREP